jgi:hypothetical protein
MHTAYVAITVLAAFLAAFSALGKIRHDPKIVKVIHDVVGVPMKYFLPLAACEFAGALGLLAGILWPPIGVAAGIGLILYFIGAVVAHLRAGDAKGIGPAAFMLAMAAAACLLRVLTMSRA